MQPNDNDTTDRDVAFEPVDRKEWEAPEEETRTYGGPLKTGPNPAALIGIAVVVIILIIILIYLIV